MLEGAFYMLIGTRLDNGKITVLATSQDIAVIRTSALFNRSSYKGITLITSPCGGLEFREADFNVVDFKPDRANRATG